MENIYALGDKYNQLSLEYDEISDVLNREYEDNGGEVTDYTEELESRRQDLENMRREVLSEVISLPDEYAAIVKNEEAQKKIMEAELKAIKEEQAKVVAKYQAKINRKANKIAWFKQNIADAMEIAGVEKIGGAKTPNKFTLWFKDSESIETDDSALLKPYEREFLEARAGLPDWIVLKPTIVKSAMDKEHLPEGAVLNKTKNLQIK